MSVQGSKCLRLHSIAIIVLFQWLSGQTRLEVTYIAVVIIFDAKIAIIGKFELIPKNSILQELHWIFLSSVWNKSPCVVWRKGYVLLARLGSNQLQIRVLQWML